METPVSIKRQQSEKQTRSDKSAQGGQLLLLRAFPLSQGQTLVWARCCTADGGGAACDQVLAKERWKTPLKRLSRRRRRVVITLPGSARPPVCREDQPPARMAPEPESLPHARPLTERLDSLLTLKDYKGQALAEQMFQEVTFFYSTWIQLCACG